MKIMLDVEVEYDGEGDFLSRIAALEQVQDKLNHLQETGQLDTDTNKASAVYISMTEIVQEAG